MGKITGIDDIIVTPLKTISVNGGDVLHGLKNGDTGFVGFGEVYFSKVGQNSIKAWKLHSKMTLNLIVPFGEVKFVFCDKSSNFREEVIGLNNYARITVPPLIWFGFLGLFHEDSIVMNLADIIHDANEVERKNLNEIEYKWETKP